MTFENLPLPIEKAISTILQQQETSEWVNRARDLHIRYTTGKTENKTFVHDYVDALAYLGLRAPATYAQILGALHAIEKVVPSWRPISLLDIGSGPGTGSWAALSLWPELEKITCLDKETNFISLGKQIITDSGLLQQVQWVNSDVHFGIEEGKNSYDLIIVANVLNELAPATRENLVKQLLTHCTGILIIIEPGTPHGSQIVSSLAQKLGKDATLLAPYIANSFVENKDYYLHFPQRFIRPDFQRRIRQQMRGSSEMASDWEETKYSYVALSTFPAEKNYWTRTVGPTEIQKGFLEVPILTADSITKIKVMKRNKEAFTSVKRLKWGDPITNKL